MSSAIIFSLCSLLRKCSNSGSFFFVRSILALRARAKLLRKIFFDGKSCATLSLSFPSPMHYGLSNVIIRDKKFAKVCKSKTLILAHFLTKRAQFFFKRSKTANILQQIFFQFFLNEKMWKCWHLMTEKLKGWSHKLETLHVETLGAILKKTRKQKKCGGSPSLWNLHLKYTNISQIFHNLIQSQTIFG